ncbi:hypothetical protein RchiOBHm_Chr2g0132381 [Rosa chinensis]|uniref:Uncharacterized protein n=1 Tax=Rosa chinensis TaxID=74649 RepID=A0A2P6RVA9_ROSCH|nr:hypothetical protein RchiOBHm_Chr2g0132381 [Rosa chinensis]
MISIRGKEFARRIASRIANASAAKGEGARIFTVLPAIKEPFQFLAKAATPYIRVSFC